MRHVAALLVLLLAALPISAKKTAKDEVRLSFAGALKRVTKKEVVIQPDNDNEMTFTRTKRTSFTSGGRQMDGSQLPAGIVVTVQAEQKLTGELEAVTVSVAAPDQLGAK